MGVDDTAVQFCLGAAAGAVLTPGRPTDGKGNLGLLISLVPFNLQDEDLCLKS